MLRPGLEKVAADTSGDIQGVNRKEGKGAAGMTADTATEVRVRVQEGGDSLDKNTDNLDLSSKFFFL